jgi:hypothetical protein
MVGFISPVRMMDWSAEGLMTLTAINRWLREEAISLRLEIAALRGHMKTRAGLSCSPQLRDEC